MSGFTNVQSNGQSSKPQKDSSLLSQEQQMAMTVLGSPFPPLPDVFSGDALHSVRAFSEHAYVLPICLILSMACRHKFAIPPGNMAE